MALYARRPAIIYQVTHVVVVRTRFPLNITRNIGNLKAEIIDIEL